MGLAMNPIPEIYNGFKAMFGGRGMSAVTDSNAGRFMGMMKAAQKANQMGYGGIFKMQGKDGISEMRLATPKNLTLSRSKQGELMGNDMMFLYSNKGDGSLRTAVKAGAAATAGAGVLGTGYLLSGD